MRIYYNCYYDGNECDKVIPKIDEQGNIIEEKHHKVIENSWDVCESCNRNYSLGSCHGILKIGKRKE